MPKLDVDKMLKDIDKGKGPSTAGELRPFYRKYEYDTPMKMPKKPEVIPVKSHMPKGATQSPKGDLGKLQDAELKAAFPRAIKRAGVADYSSDYLPVRPFAKAGGDNS